MIRKLGLRINRHNVLISNNRKGLEVLAEAIEHVVKKQNEIIDTLNKISATQQSTNNEEDK